MRSSIELDRIYYKKIYYKNYYHQNLAQGLRLKRWGDKRCLECGVPMISKYGSKYSRKVCLSEGCKVAHNRKMSNIRNKRYKLRLKSKSMV